MSPLLYSPLSTVLLIIILQTCDTDRLQRKVFSFSLLSANRNKSTSASRFKRTFKCFTFLLLDCSYWFASLFVRWWDRRVLKINLKLWILRSLHLWCCLHSLITQLWNKFFLLHFPNIVKPPSPMPVTNKLNLTRFIICPSVLKMFQLYFRNGQNSRPYVINRIITWDKRKQHLA